MYFEFSSTRDVWQLLFHFANLKSTLNYCKEYLVTQKEIRK